MKSGAAVVLCAFIALALWGCESSETEDRATLADLTVHVIDGAIHADMMPPVAPDPIVCSLTFRLVNNDADRALGGVLIPSADVFLSRTSEELGTIRFRTDWDGMLDPGEADTVTVAKIAESEEIFPPPCRESVFLRVKIVRTAVQSKQVSTPSYPFSCPAAVRAGGP